MVRSLASIEKEITELDSEDQEELLRFLLEELDGPSDADVESVWLDEAARRASEIDAGTVQCVPAGLVRGKYAARFAKGARSAERAHRQEGGFLA